MKRTPMHKHIYKTGNTYSIVKSIKGKRIFFKSCSTLHEAMQYRNRLMKNNWEPLPETPEEQEEKKIKEYYKHIQLSGRKRYYAIRNGNDGYLGMTKSIEKALYFRDLYINTPLEEVPNIKDVDLRTDNPYYEGLKYPLPERLIRPENNSTYGTGSIIKKGPTSFHVHHGKKGNGFNSYVCSCPTREMAEYVKAEMNKVGWDKSKLQGIIDDYPRYYTKLLFFYQYISKVRNHKGELTGQYKVVPPLDVTDGKLENIIYNNIEDALFERDFLKENGWDYDLLVELINDEDNPYYDMDLPTYPTRRIRNVSERNYRETELTEVMELIKDDPSLSQREIADKLDITEVTLRNWLKRLYNTNYRDFKRLVLDGVNPLDVLEKNEQIIQPDLSTAKPNNYKGYVHHMKNGNYNVCKGGEYYGTYKDEKLAKKIAKDLMKCDFDKSKLKAIQKKHGYTSLVMSKRWVYKQGKKYAVRRKDKNRKMITYGVWYDKRIAVIARDMYVEYGFNLDNQSWINNMAEWIVEMRDLLPFTMFGKCTLEDIKYIESSSKIPYCHQTISGKYQINKTVNGKLTSFGSYSEEKALRVVEFLMDNNWDKELLEVMMEMGEI